MRGEQHLHPACHAALSSLLARPHPPTLQVKVQTVPGYAKGLADGLPKFVAQEGVGGLFKGLTPLWGRQIPYTMMKFGAFENTVQVRGHARCAAGSGTRMLPGCGPGASGVTAEVALYPGLAPHG